MNGATTRYEYDGLGRLWRVTTYDDPQAFTKSEQEFDPSNPYYDPANALTTHIYGYALNGNKTYDKTYEKNPDGIVTRGEYNLSNCLMLLPKLFGRKNPTIIDFSSVAKAL